MSFDIGSFRISADGPVFIVAELSANHNGSLDTAIETIRAAKKAGADAIKLQTYTPDTITLNARTDMFRISGGTIWDGQYLYDLFQDAHTPWAWHERLFEVAAEEGLVCFSSPFDPTAVDLLEKLDAPAYKIASFEITDVGLIEYAAAKGKPMIISTGIAELEDIELAVKTCREAGNDQIMLLKCTSSYPAPVDQANLRTMLDLAARFGVYAGLSDHTLGIAVPVAATALGTRMIEKHFILDRSIGGPDADFSLDFDQFSEMVKQVRDAEASLGKVSYELSEKSINARNIGGRSLFIAQDVKAGEEFTQENVRSVRPGYGIHPKHLREVLGKKAKSDLTMGTPLAFEHFRD